MFVEIPVLTFPSFSFVTPGRRKESCTLLNEPLIPVRKLLRSTVLSLFVRSPTKGFTFSSLRLLRQLVSDAGYFTHVVIICADFSKLRRIRLKASEVIQGILFALLIENMQICMSG